MTATRVLLFLMLAGAVIVALPDSDIRLFSFSKDHGPSMQDGIGLVLILVPYTFLIRRIWKNRGSVMAYQHTWAFKAGIFIAGFGSGLIIASVAGDYKSWWIYGIVLLIIVQSITFYVALRSK